MSSRPPFSPSLERLCPALASARENQLYHFFRERRLAPRTMGARLRTWRNTLLHSDFLLRLGAPAAVGLALAAAFFVFPCLGCCLTLVLALSLVAIRFGTGGRKSGLNHVPDAVGSIFRGGLQVPLAIDIWLAGNDGNDIAEAIFLEEVEFLVGWYRALYLFFGFVLLSILWGLAALDRPAMLLCMGAAALALWMALRMVDEAAIEDAHRHVDRITAAWRQDADLGRISIVHVAFDWGLLPGMAAWFLVLCLAAILSALPGFVAYLLFIPALIAIQMGRIYLAIVSFCLGAVIVGAQPQTIALFILLAGVLARNRRRIFSMPQLLGGMRRLEVSAMAFDAFMRCAVMGDVDAGVPGDLRNLIPAERRRPTG